MTADMALVIDRCRNIVRTADIAGGRHAWAFR